MAAEGRPATGGETKNRPHPTKRRRISTASRTHQLALRPEFGTIGVKQQVYETSGLNSPLDIYLNPCCQVNQSIATH
jgi:hypothetical protein